jgi:hypothetical protein
MSHARYWSAISHVRVKAKQDAIRALDIGRSKPLTEGAQKGAQIAESEKTHWRLISEGMCFKTA